MKYYLCLGGPADGRIVPLSRGNNVLIVEDVRYEADELIMGDKRHGVLIAQDPDNCPLVDLIEGYSTLRHRERQHEGVPPMREVKAK